MAELKNMTTQEQAQEILRIAEKYGVEQNFLFKTTFQKYITLLNMCNELEKQWKADGTTVSKEYVKGRQNIVIHPAVKQYTTACAAANKTVSTLMKIIKEMRGNAKNNNTDVNPLLKALGIIGDDDAED